MDILVTFLTAGAFLLVSFGLFWFTKYKKSALGPDPEPLNKRVKRIHDYQLALEDRLDLLEKQQEALGNKFAHLRSTMNGHVGKLTQMYEPQVVSIPDVSEIEMSTNEEPEPQAVLPPMR